jgi:hypothetical protein
MSTATANRCPDCGVSIPAKASSCTRLHRHDYRVTVSRRGGSGSSFTLTEHRDGAIDAAAEYLASLSPDLRNVSDFWADALALVMEAEADRVPGGIGCALIVNDIGQVAVEHRREAQRS